VKHGWNLSYETLRPKQFHPDIHLQNKQWLKSQMEIGIQLRHMMKEGGVPEPRCLTFHLRIDNHC
jgi:hypothetical protein